ncbi:MAG: GDP-mannose 6-dehydrogenase [Edafosvirus sp.]|uniref:GDP-mannose 6-dehydrogenase n=1 Tax=Edafosvirus sp. TaxID=2487765 RepID=A0A3G4ZX75_9VIRU|nr:MAG: GDP-mannose 6-dehydrogenase [Edafosvirus sp.]
MSASQQTSQNITKTETNEKKFKVTQIGLGVVGGSFGLSYKKVGCDVVGIEASKELVEKFKKEFETYHISDDLSHVKDVDFIFLSINTPLDEATQKLNLKYLFSSIPNVCTIVKNSPKALVVVRSTVPPTTTNTYKKELEALCGFKVNVLFQPEYLRAYSAKKDSEAPLYIIIGRDEGTDVSSLIELYSKFIAREKIEEMTIEEAELQKLFHNCFNATKISYFNQCKLLMDAVNKEHKSNINADRVIMSLANTCEGLWNRRYGLKSGHAFGGFCLPKDMKQAAYLEKIYGLKAQIFKSVNDVNEIYKATDREEILVGDFHMSYDKV